MKTSHGVPLAYPFNILSSAILAAISAFSISFIYSLQALFLGSQTQAMPTTLPQFEALSFIIAGSAKSQGGKHTAALLLAKEPAHPLSALIARHSSTHFKVNLL